MDSLINPEDTWTLWAAIVAIATFALWAEKTHIGQKVSAAVIAILLALTLTNVGILPAESNIYTFIWTNAIPMTIPMLLFQANIARVFKESGRVLVAFLIGGIGTVVGALLAYASLPLDESAAGLVGAVTAAYIGGTLNFVATANSVGLDSAKIAAGIAAANLVVVLYLVVLFTLPSIRHFSSRFNRSPEPKANGQPNLKPEIEQFDTVMGISYTVLISSIICMLGFGLEAIIEFPGTAILAVTFLSLAAASAFPSFFRKLTISAYIGTAILHLFFAAIGASASIHEVVAFGPVLLALCAISLAVHFTFLSVGAKLTGITLDEMLIGSNACAAGAPTAAAMAASLRVPHLVLPAILCGTLGYAVGTFVGVLIAGIL